MEDAAGGHGFPLKGGEKIVEFVQEICEGGAPEEIAAWAKELRASWETAQAAKETAPAPASSAAVKKTKVQAGLAQGAIRAAQEGAPVFSVSSDVQGSTGISTFQKSLGRFVEVGIAEANMVSMGAGLAKAGFIPIVDTFGQFGVTKGNLPLTMASLSQAPVIAIFSHVGFQDAADGASHQATTYFSAVSAIPHTVVIAPSCATEAEALMYEAIKRQAADREAGRDGESYVFFVGRENYPVSWLPEATYPWGRAQVTQEGEDVVLVGCGTLFSKAVEAGTLLAQEGIKATVINNPFINRVDLETLGAAVRKCGRLVTIEDHQVVCGMGSQLSSALSAAGIAHRLRSLGIQDEFGQSAYLAEHLYEKHGLTGPKMAEAARSLLQS
jgi:transketolase